MDNAAESFAARYEKEHDRTMRVLRAYPTDQLDLRPHPRLKTARELAWIFVLECKLGPAIFNNQFEQFTGSGKAPDPPESWDEILSTLEKAHAEYVALIRSTPPGEFDTKVKFLTGPRQVGEMTRTEWLEFMLGDEIHHRGQFSVYLRMAGGKVPSIYGPTADEPWM